MGCQQEISFIRNNFAYYIIDQRILFPRNMPVIGKLMRFQVQFIQSSS